MIRWLTCALIGTAIGTGIVVGLCALSGCRSAGNVNVRIKGATLPQTVTVTVTGNDTTLNAQKEVMRGAKGTVDVSPIP